MGALSAKPQLFLDNIPYSDDKLVISLDQFGTSIRNQIKPLRMKIPNVSRKCKKFYYLPEFYLYFLLNKHQQHVCNFLYKTEYSVYYFDC